MEVELESDTWHLGARPCSSALPHVDAKWCQVGQWLAETYQEAGAAERLKCVHQLCRASPSFHVCPAMIGSASSHKWRGLGELRHVHVLRLTTNNIKQEQTRTPVFNSVCSKTFYICGSQKYPRRDLTCILLVFLCISTRRHLHLVDLE